MLWNISIKWNKRWWENDKIWEKIPDIQDIYLMVHQLVETCEHNMRSSSTWTITDDVLHKAESHKPPLPTHSSPWPWMQTLHTVCVCVCDFPLTMSPGQWPPTNVNHGSNDAGRVHEEVVSPVLPVLVNLTGPGTSVIPPWGGKNTAGLGTQCVCDHRRTSNRHFMHVHGCRRTEEPCSCKSSRFQGLFFLSFLIDHEHYDAAVYPYPGGYVKL